MFSVRTKFDSKEKIWYGNDVSPVFHSDVSIGQVALHMLSLNPNKIVQINDNNGTQFTANEIRLMSIRVAQNLQNRGYKQEDIFGIIASNTEFLAPLVFGCLLNGISINSLDPSINKGEIKHMFGITRPKLIFCDANVYTELSMALDELNLNSSIYIVNGKVEGINSIEEILANTGDEKHFIPPKLIKGGKQIAAIVCSSGTTGLPKGVCMTHRSLLKLSMTTLSCEDVVLCFSTLYWISGLVALLAGTFATCTRLLTNEPFSPELALHIIEKYKVTFFLSPPSQMAVIVKCPDIKYRDLTSIKVYMCGGSVVPVPVAKQMSTYLKKGELLTAYGMSEIAGFASIQAYKRAKEGSVGELLNNIKIKIVDDNGKQLGIGEKGEILINNGQEGLGYYNNIEETKATIDSEGWVHSGDIGYFDADGHLYIVDRKKEILKYNNFHFYPNEIENVILQIPDVVEVCVCGIPDIVATDLPAAAVVKVEGSSLSNNDIYSFVAEHMAHFKHLRGGVYFLESLPKTASGKVQRQKVRDLLQSLYKKETVPEK